VGVVHGFVKEMGLPLRSRQTDLQNVQIVVADLHVVLHILQMLNDGVDSFTHTPTILHNMINLESGIRIVLIEELSQTTLALSSFISAQRLVPTAPVYPTDNMT
jgi:hypothetical protein